MITEKFPDRPDLLELVPSPDGIDPDKKLPNSVWTTDTCNAASKFQNIACETYAGGLKQDCHNHLRNVWVGGLELELSSYLSTILRDSLDKIDSNLRVKTLFSAFARAYDKGFSLSANYPKGFGELFIQWMMDTHPSYVLYHVERVRGARQDMILEAALAIYMNREVNVDFLDHMLSTPGKSSENVLMRNLFLLLGSPEMAAQSRFLCIIYFSICIPMRWLAGKTQELKDYPVGARPENQWCSRSMGRVLDTFYQRVKNIIALPSLFLSESYMMSLFSEFEEELPPFKKYMNDTFTKRSMIVRSRKSGMRVAHLAMAKRELFNPRKSTNIKTTSRLLELICVGFSRIKTELEDKRKANYRNLSISGDSRSWAGCTDADKVHTRGCYATNDLAESALGGATRGIQLGGTINLGRAGAESNFKRNKWTYRHIRPTRGSQKQQEQSDGMFHMFCGEIQHCLIATGVKEWPATHEKNNELLAAQRLEKRTKQQILKRKGAEKTQKKLIHAIYCYEMNNSSACVKGDPKEVTRMLKKFTSDTAKKRFLRSNIEMRVIGYGGDFLKFEITWSVKGKNRSVKELADHLRKIIRAEATMDIPDKPPVYMPKRVEMRKLGEEWTDEVKSLDRKYFSKESKFREDAEVLRKELEARGEGSMYSMMQPWLIPELVEIVGDRIDVLSSFDVVVDGAKVTSLRWCQGLVKSVVDDAREPTVVVEWDGMPDVTGWENKCESVQVLKRHLWNKDKEGAWRMDIDVEPCEAYESDSDSDCDSTSDDDDGSEEGGIDELSVSDGSHLSVSDSSTDYGDSDSDSDSDAESN